MYVTIGDFLIFIVVHDPSRYGYLMIRQKTPHDVARQLAGPGFRIGRPVHQTSKTGQHNPLHTSRMISI